MAVKAIDNDVGENGRITYHFKVNNNYTQETNGFYIDIDTGNITCFNDFSLAKEHMFSVSIIMVFRRVVTILSLGLHCR